MRRYKDKVEVDALPFKSVVGMGQGRRMRDGERRYGVDFVGHGFRSEKGEGLADFVVGDTEIPFLAWPSQYLPLAWRALNAPNLGECGNSPLFRV